MATTRTLQLHATPDMVVTSRMLSSDKMIVNVFDHHDTSDMGTTGVSTSCLTCSDLKKEVADLQQQLQRLRS